MDYFLTFQAHTGFMCLSEGFENQHSETLKPKDDFITLIYFPRWHYHWLKSMSTVLWRFKVWETTATLLMQQTVNFLQHSKLLVCLQDWTFWWKSSSVRHILAADYYYHHIITIWSLQHPKLHHQLLPATAVPPTDNATSQKKNTVRDCWLWQITLPIKFYVSAGWFFKAYWDEQKTISLAKKEDQTKKKWSALENCRL